MNALSPSPLRPPLPRPGASARPGGAGWWIVLLAVATAANAGGCGGGRRPRPPAAKADASRADEAVPVRQAMSREVRERLLEGAMDVLGTLENYDENLAAAQVFDRLNQWSHAVGDVGGEGDASPWRRDPLLEGLPERLRGGGVLRGVDGMAFDAVGDIPALRDQRWLADVASTARGDAIDDLDVARRLFDWTVRSLAITTDPPMVPSDASPGTRWFTPGEILLAGRASAPQRAWIFLELLRHAGLEGVMLATGDTTGGASPRPWIPALVSGGEAYLFDPAYGMPVPGPGGEGVATARQAAADPAILGAMSLPDRPYPVQAADVGRLGVLVPATPWSLARRMHYLDRQLVGARRIAVSIDASAVATRALAALPDAPEEPAGRAGLWEFPWETIKRRQLPASAAAVSRELGVMSLALAREDEARTRRAFRPLYAGRLREFRGQFDGPEGAKAAYLAARPGSAALAEAVAALPPPQADLLKRTYEEMKADATYWLGVITLGEKDYSTAVDYLDRMTLKDNPEGVWADAARLNLAVARLGLGEREEAARLLREDPSPQRFGSRIVAERLAPGGP